MAKYPTFVSMIKKSGFIFFLLIQMNLVAQIVYENQDNVGIYEFLDEMANLRLIELNSAIKPYARSYIAGKLSEIRAIHLRGGYPLNKRQQFELHHYLNDYQQELPQGKGYRWSLDLIRPSSPTLQLAADPPGLHYRDSLFRLSLRPILGATFLTNENGNGYQRWWGGELMGYIGKNVGFYVELRDNNASEPFAKPDYLTLQRGTVYKTRDNGSVDFSEMRGGITGSVKWGSIGILLDRFEWGDNLHGANILGGKAPSVPYVSLRLNPVKWFNFSYFHGWLNSNIIDSSRSYYTDGEYRIVYRNKFTAANMFTFTPWRGLNISVGNSIIYSDQNINPLFFIPFIFFNAADAVRSNYENNGGSNTQMFFNISSRQIRHLHLYISWLADEWKTSRLFDPERHNFTSFKAGFALSGLLLKNVTLAAEYTRTMPMTYKHYIPSAVYSSNDFTLGHYLKDNSEEIYIMLAWRPVSGLKLSGAWTTAIRGEDFPYDYHAGYEVDKIPFIEKKTWQNNSLELSARFEFVNDGYFYVQYIRGDRTGITTYQPELMQGTTNTFSTGILVGF